MQFATLEWKDGQPYAPDFGDIYFSSDNGLQETEHVFVQGNALESRFPQALQGFSIIETGFGTGLNFFAVVGKWKQLAPTNARLTYISMEKFPLTTADMQQACACWPAFSEMQQRFLPHYARLQAGENVWQITPHITLQLWIGDVLDSLPQLTDKADAWLLDGFAPAKNPDMWSEWLFTHMARLSKPDSTTLATFTSAGQVRRGLQAAGFEVRKVPGFGRKREMICGVFRGRNEL
jgi:tRNA 5-methylaminomethyl-2-thiouridine biosynthesis bifunctional protein